MEKLKQIGGLFIVLVVQLSRVNGVTSCWQDHKKKKSSSSCERMQQRREAKQVVESLVLKLLLLLLVLLTFNKQYGVQSQSSVTRLLSEQDTEVLLGSNATINCSVPTGTRSITWLLNGVVIAQNRNPYYSQYSIVGTDRGMSTTLLYAIKCLSYK